MRGHLRKRGKNSWTIVVDLGRDPSSGKRRQQWVSIKGNKRDADRRLGEILHQLDTGGMLMPAKTTVADFFKSWLRDYVETNLRPRTIEGYRMIIEAHLIPALGHILLGQLLPAHLQSYYTEKLKHGRRDGRGGLSARTVLHHHRVLSEALGHAVNWGLVFRNIAKAVTPPRPDHKEMNPLDRDGIILLLNAAQSTPYHPLLHLAIYTGMRRSELLGLRWKDVDFDMSNLSVVQTMHQLRDGRIIFQEPKTSKGRRMIALSPAAVISLRAHREQQEAERNTLGLQVTGDSLVFSKHGGRPLSPNSLSSAYTRLVKKAGLSHVRFHDLRHTHATLMLKQGVHPKIVQERLGHANISITLDTYSHVTPGLQEAAALRFDEGLCQEKPILLPVGTVDTNG